MKDNSNRNGINAGKPAYDGLSVRIVEVFPSGVLCASKVDDITAMGGSGNPLDLYNGHAL